MKSTKKELVKMLLENQRLLGVQRPMQVVFDESFPFVGKPKFEPDAIMS